MFTLNPQSGIPIYRQLVDQIRNLIAGHQLMAGDKLPSVRELALRHAISPMTISKAYSLAEAEGLLVRQRGKAMTVADRPGCEDLHDDRLQQLESTVRQTVTTAKQLGLRRKDVAALISSIWKGQ